MPVEVVREAKARAAREGTTLAAYVARALEAFGNAAANDIGEDPRERDWQWYERNRARLAKRYKDEYVAILDERVVDHDRDFEALSLRVASEHRRSAFMPKVSAKERVLRVRSPRLDRT